MLFSGVITALILIKHDLSSFTEKKPVIQLFTLCAAASVLLYTGIGSFTVFRQPIDADFWTGPKSILRILEEQDLTYGYSLDHWFGNSITVLTDERIQVREVIWEDGQLSPSPLQSNVHWFTDQPGIEKYFLICQEQDYWQHPSIADGAIAEFRADQERTFRDGKAGFFIFVFDKNLF